MLAPGLPRRAFLGVELAPGDPFARGGLVVGGVAPGSMAERAGLERDDLVRAIDGWPLSSAEALRLALRAAGARDEVTLALERGGAPLERRVGVQPRAEERLEGQEVLYDHVVADGARQRVIVTRATLGAAVARPARAPAVLFLQGITCSSIELHATPDAPLARLVAGWAARGFVTMRLERRGVGDSDGDEAEASTDLAMELAGARAALRALASYAFVDPAAVFVFGHSLGGIVAPLLAGEALARGLVVYGTTAAPWLTSMASGFRRRLSLLGVPVDARERHVARDLAAVTALLRDDAVGTFAGRCAALHRQLHACDVAAAWRGLALPSLVLRGEFDALVGPEEAAELVELASARGPGRSTHLELAGLDHAMTAHATLAASLRAPGAGAFDARLVDETAAWMRRSCAPR